MDFRFENVLPRAPRDLGDIHRRPLLVIRTGLRGYFALRLLYERYLADILKANRRPANQQNACSSDSRHPASNGKPFCVAAGRGLYGLARANSAWFSHANFRKRMCNLPNLIFGLNLQIQTLYGKTLLQESEFI